MGNYPISCNNTILIAAQVSTLSSSSLQLNKSQKKVILNCVLILVWNQQKSTYCEIAMFKKACWRRNLEERIQIKTSWFLQILHTWGIRVRNVLLLKLILFKIPTFAVGYEASLSSWHPLHGPVNTRKEFQSISISIRLCFRRCILMERLNCKYLAQFCVVRFFSDKTLPKVASDMNDNQL